MTETTPTPSSTTTRSWSSTDEGERPTLTPTSSDEDEWAESITNPEEKVGGTPTPAAAVDAERIAPSAPRKAPLSSVPLKVVLPKNMAKERAAVKPFLSMKRQVGSDIGRGKDKKGKGKKSKKGKGKGKGKGGREREAVRGQAPDELAYVNDGLHRTVLNVKKYVIPWAALDKYKIDLMAKIGEGTYGRVYLAQRVADKTRVVAKEIKQEKFTAERFKQEVMIMDRLSAAAQRGGVGAKSMVKLLDVARESATGLRYLMLEYVRSPPYKDIIPALEESGIGGSRRLKMYLYSFLESLVFTHSHGVIHRDVKGANTVFDINTHAFGLLDWGFAFYYNRKAEMTSFPGTRYYKAPEMFLHYRRYDFAVDVWSFATVMAMLVSGRHPFFPVNYPATNFGQMMGIVAFTGLDAYEALLDKYDFPQDYVVKYHPSIFHEMKIPGGRVVWNSLRNRQNKTRLTPDACDLLDKLLVLDHERRLTAAEALLHPYFDQVRDSFASPSGPSAPSGASKPRSRRRKRGKRRRLTVSSESSSSSSSTASNSYSSSSTASSSYSSSSSSTYSSSS